MAGNEDLINALYKFYISQGFSKYGAAYMVGSMIQESRLNPAAVEVLASGKTGPGRGLGQWSYGKGSYASMVQYASEYGRGPTDLVAQAHFAVQQAPKVTNLFKTADDVASAKAAVKAFENYGVEGADRFSTAATIYANVEAGKAAGAGLGGKVDPKLDDLAGVIKDLQSKFTKNAPDSGGASCKAKSSPAKKAPQPKVQLNVQAKLYKPPAGSGTP